MHHSIGSAGHYRFHYRSDAVGCTGHELESILLWRRGKCILGHSHTGVSRIALYIACDLDGDSGQTATRGSEDRARKFAAASVFVVIMAAFLMGYIFVEVIPTRIVAQAYVYRMLPVFMWLGWILIRLLKNGSQGGVESVAV